mgnify:FL=1
MSVHLRQICLVAAELQPVVEQLTNVFDIKVCHRDPVVKQYGLENVLLPLGTDFLEVVAPIEENTAASRYLNRLGRNGGYMVILQADSKDTQTAIRSRALAARVRIAHEEERDGWSSCQLHPADMEAAFLDIEWDAQGDFTGCWHPAGGLNWLQFRQKNTAVKLVGAQLNCSDPLALARLWRDILGTGVEDAEREISLINGKLRFAECGSREYGNLAGITLGVKDKQRIISLAHDYGCVSNFMTGSNQEELEICGTKFTLVDL